MDLLLELAAERGAPLALANDPDADRLGAAIPQPDGSWRRLGGDEIGWLLADHILRHTAGDDRLVVTTLVSSSLLGGDGRRPRRALRRDVHRVQVDRPGRPRSARAAARVRLRAGARVPGRAGARWTRTGSRRRCCWPRSPRWRRPRGRTLQDRLDDARRPVRPARDRRPVGPRWTRRRRRRWSRQLQQDPPTELAGPRSTTSCRSRRPACCASCWPAASACRSARAAPNPRSSSTAKPSTSTPPPPSTPSTTQLLKRFQRPPSGHKLPGERRSASAGNGGARRG